MLLTQDIRSTFKDFLDRETFNLGMTHHYKAKDYGLVCYSHTIKRSELRKFRVWILTYRVFVTTIIADIIGEPESPVEGACKDRLVIKLRNKEFLPQMKELAGEFESKFGMKAEIIY